MKKTILNVGAILAAFLIGLAINNACADSLENMSDSELRNLVSQLQKEVTALKQRVSELEGKIGSGGSTSPSLTVGFDVDGLHFDNSGYVEQRIKQSGLEPYSYYIIDGKKTETTSQQGGYTYTYDSYGRLSKQVLNSSSSELTLSYSYSGKSMTLETITKYKNPSAGSIQESYSKSTTIYE